MIKTNKNIEKNFNFPKRIIPVIISVFIVILIVISLWISGAFSGKNKTADISVPDITGINLEEAQKILLKNNLSICISDTVIDDSVEENTVLKQIPSPGETAEINSSVNVTVSERSVKAVIPDLKYFDKDLAVKILQHNGFNVEIKSENNSDFADGTVINQNIIGESKTGSTVIITVASGYGNTSEQVITKVPSIINLSLNEAREKLKNSSLLLKVENEEYSEDVKKGLIISQSPGSKSEVNINSPVCVVVSKGSKNNIKIIVPNVLYHTKSQAKKILEEKELSYSVEEKFDSVYPAGIVIKQSINKGETVNYGTSITITVSKGKGEENTTSPKPTMKYTLVTNNKTTKPAVQTTEKATTSNRPSAPVVTQPPVDTSTEKKYTADFRITTDKTTASPGDSVKVSVHLKTNYKIIALSLPVIYDGDVFEMENTSGTLSSFLTFGGSLKDARYSTNGNWKSPAQMYRKTSNPDYWEKDSVMDRWKISFATWIALLSDNTELISLDKEETIVSFTLKVKNVPSGTNGKIFIDSDFLKTADNPAGILSVGRAKTDEINSEFNSYGQTINIDKANTSIKIK